jgi:hypothetical protein
LQARRIDRGLVAGAIQVSKNFLQLQSKRLAEAAFSSRAHAAEIQTLCGTAHAKSLTELNIVSAEL